MPERSESLTTDHPESSTPPRRSLNPLLVLGIVGILVSGASFAAGYFLPAGSANPFADPTAIARPVPTEPVGASAVRTCSVGSAMNDTLLGTQTVVVFDESGSPLLTNNAEDPIPMGSVMKVITAAVALDILGKDGRLTTRVVDGSTAGTVIVIGGGDPTLRAGGTSVYAGSASIAELASETVTSYQAEYPENPTITRVSIDLSMFPIDDAWHPTWPESERTIGYQPRIVPFIVDGDRAKPGQQTSPRSTDPAGRAANAFVAALQQAGNGDGDVEIDYESAPSNATELASVSSAPVSQLIPQMLLYSDNTLAEFLMRTSSVSAGFDGGSDSIQQLVLSSLIKHGVDMTGATFVDGSGESASDLIPPRAMVELVQQIFQGDAKLAAIGDALPVAGRSGTLTSRFVGDAEIAREHVFAKTGWIYGVYSLAGQIETESDGRLSFVVVARGEVDATAIPAIDKLVAGIYSCGSNLSSF